MNRRRVVLIAVLLSLFVVLGAWALLRLVGLQVDPAILAIMGVVAGAAYATARLGRRGSNGS